MNGEHDVPVYMTFPGQHRTKLHSTSTIARLNEEVERRAEDVGIFPNEALIARPVGAGPFEQTTHGGPPADTCGSRLSPKSTERQQTQFQASRPPDRDLGSSGKLH